MIRSSSSTIMVKNYYIILIHAVYDIPGKSSDGMECLMPLDEIYDHISLQHLSGKASQGRTLLQCGNKQYRGPHPGLDRGNADLGLSVSCI